MVFDKSVELKQLDSSERISTLKRPVWLFVLPWSLTHLGGVNQVVINLASHMALAGSHEAIVLVTDWEAKIPVWEIIHGVKVVRWRVRTLDPAVGWRKKLIFKAWNLIFKNKFTGFCKRHGVAVINPHYPTSTAFTLKGAVSKAKCKPQMVVSVHGADLTGIEAAGPDAVALWRDFLAEADALVACSDALGQRAVQIFGKGVSPTTVHNGIDVERFVQLAGRRMPMERRVVLSVGKFEQKKGQDVLIRAFARIAKNYADLDLVFIGATAGALQELRNLCTTENIETRVFFHADMPNSEVAVWFQQATLFVLPSRQEPFGIVLLEAGCLGIPVIASQVGGIPEILTEGVTGCMVAPDDVPGLAGAMQRLLDDLPAARSMGERLRICVTGNFSWAAAHDKYQRIVSKVSG